MSFYLVILDDSERTIHNMWVVADHGAAQAMLNELLPLETRFRIHFAGPYNLGEDMLDDRIYYTCDQG
jgi:hypothetical protein